MGKQAGKRSIVKRGNQGKNTRKNPHEQKVTGRTHGSGDVRADNKYS
jgi:hypothetical protein